MPVRGRHRRRRSFAGLLTSACLVAGPAAAGLPVGAHAFAAPISNRQDIVLSQAWEFHKGDVTGAQLPSFDDSAWRAIHLPHTWNAFDGEDGGNNYYRGVGWYRTHETIDSSLLGRNFYLQFDGANIVTDVWLNGNYLGQHQGGFAAFRFDGTPYAIVGGDNVIAVKVSNAFNVDVPPLQADFTFFGGLYRSAHLLVTDPLHVYTLDYGSAGVYLMPTDVSAASANLQVTIKVWNGYAAPLNVTVNTVIVDAAGNLLQMLGSTVTMPNGAVTTVVQTTTVRNPHLWNGIPDPYLYRAYVEIFNGASLVDVVGQPLGFRYYSVDPNLGFFLNGHYLDLHGINRHQDFQNMGWAISQTQMDTDFALIREIGATAVRLSHYQHDQYFYGLTDQHGLVVWAEIPLIDYITDQAAFTANAEQQLIELIRQNFNHPSIFFWSIANEITLLPGPSPTSLLSQLNSLAHSEDPTRLTTHATQSNPNVATDLVGFNRYYGWFYGNMNQFASAIDMAHQANPTLKIAISEYGAGTNIAYQTDIPVKMDYSEQYQALFHETYWQAMSTRPYLWAKFVWSMFEYASDAQNVGGEPGRVILGLATYDRHVKKDSFYWYKANWSSTPFVHINDSRFNPRIDSVTNIKVYSNTSSVELFLNGVSLGVRTSNNHIFLWSDVTLAAGVNNVQAVGMLGAATYSDSASWTLNVSTNTSERIDAGSGQAYTDSAGNVYAADTRHLGGWTGFISHTITNTADSLLYQTYRQGLFTYQLPIANGKYTLCLKFVEPSATAVGQRIFNVVGDNNVMLVSRLDIFSQVGQNSALDQCFPIAVTDGGYDLEFVPVVGNAIVSALSSS